MAGDWIKFEHVTPDKPEVINMAEILEIDQDAVVGKLVRIWIWADQNSVDGNGMTVTDTFLDRLVFQVGFAKALRQVGWLSGKNGKLTLPQFERHNGETAKKRASTNRRVAKSREKKATKNEPLTATGNTNVTPKALQKALPEKRREEKNIEYICKGADAKPSDSIPHDLTELGAPDHAPTFADIEAHMRQHNSNMPNFEITSEMAEGFFNKYESVQWVNQHNQPIKNWKSAMNGYCQTWKRNESKNENRPHRATMGKTNSQRTSSPTGTDTGAGISMPRL